MPFLIGASSDDGGLVTCVNRQVVGACIHAHDYYQAFTHPIQRKRATSPSKLLVPDLGGPFLLQFTSPRKCDPGFRFFVKQMFKTGGKKRNVPNSFFSCENGLKQW